MNQKPCVFVARSTTRAVENAKALALQERLREVAEEDAAEAAHARYAAKRQREEQQEAVRRARRSRGGRRKQSRRDTAAPAQVAATTEHSSKKEWPCEDPECSMCYHGKLNRATRNKCMGCGAPRAAANVARSDPKAAATPPWRVPDGQSLEEGIDAQLDAAVFAAAARQQSEEIVRRAAAAAKWEDLTRKQIENEKRLAMINQISRKFREAMDDREELAKREAAKPQAAATADAAAKLAGRAGATAGHPQQRQQQQGVRVVLDRVRQKTLEMRIASLEREVEAQGGRSPQGMTAIRQIGRIEESLCEIAMLLHIRTELRKDKANDEEVEEACLQLQDLEVQMAAIMSRHRRGASSSSAD